jgi:primosomal protein N'
MVQSPELMAQPSERPTNGEQHSLLYCPVCARQIDNPLTCGDCGSVICRACGTPLEMAEDLGIG